jgi:hypothetical protein
LKQNSDKWWDFLCSLVHVSECSFGTIVNNLRIMGANSWMKLMRWYQLSAVQRSGPFSESATWCASSSFICVHLCR